MGSTISAPAPVTVIRFNHAGNPHDDVFVRMIRICG
jgi:hypothetical protein